MEVNCEGCAGCCIDWRALTDADIHPEHRGRFDPVDDVGNLAPIRRDEIRTFVEKGLGDVLQPRLFASEDEDGVTIDGVDVAAIHGRPAFMIGLRKPPKPVGPFDHEVTWLPTCAFLDPTTLQCRIHDTDRYPETCSTYPGENLALDVETECERVEGVFGESRLLDDEPPVEAGPNVGPATVGTTVFAHPNPDRLTGVVDRMRGDGMTGADRAEFVAVAAASSPATLSVSNPVYEETRDAVVTADSWAGRAIEQWAERAADPGSSAPPPSAAETVEEEAGAPATPGWDAVGSDS